MSSQASQYEGLSMDEIFLKKLDKAIDDNLENPDFGVYEAGRELGISRSQMRRKLQAITGKSPSRYIRSLRLEKARELLRKKIGTVSEVADMTGFSSLSYFSQVFTDEFGFPPSEVKQAEISLQPEDLSRLDRHLVAAMTCAIDGISQIMYQSEEIAYTMIKTCREIYNEMVSNFGGHLWKETGDNHLASFPSAIDAVNCAKAIQNKARDKEIPLRIGIHIGEVLIDNEGIFGEGLNLSRKLQELATPGKILISEKVWYEIRNKSGITADCTQQTIDDNNESIKVYNVATGLHKVANLSLQSSSPTTLKADAGYLTGSPVKYRGLALILNQMTNLLSSRIGAGTLIVVSVILVLIAGKFLTWNNIYPVPSYENDFYRAKYIGAYEKSGNHLDLSDDKANYFHIISGRKLYLEYPGYSNVAEEKLTYYRNLVMQHPESAKSHLYLALAYFEFAPQYSLQWDSVWYCLKKAESLNASGEIFDIVKWQILNSPNTTTHEILIAANNLFQNYPESTLAQYGAGRTFISQRDTLLAIRAFRNSIKAQRNFSLSYMELSKIFMNLREFDSALFYSKKAIISGPGNLSVINNHSRILKQLGKYEEAKLYVTDQIKNSEIVKPGMYKVLIDLYIEQDSLDKAQTLFDLASKNFPKNSELLYEKTRIKERKNQLINTRTSIGKGEALPWSNNFVKSLEQSKKLGKPILADFTTNNSWADIRRNKYIYPDSLLKTILESYILLKINCNSNVELAEKYQIGTYEEHEYKDELLILDSSGKEMARTDGWEVAFGNINNFKDFLDNSHGKFVRINESSKIFGKPFTEVSNFESALLIAREKNLPILAVVGKMGTEWSDKLLSESINNLNYKSYFKNLIFVYINIDQQHILPAWDIQIYPTSLFFSSKGELKTRLIGFQPPEVLGAVLNDLRNNVDNKEYYNWIYGLEEAKIIASVTNKDIIVQYGNFDPELYSNVLTNTEILSKYLFVKRIRETNDFLEMVPYSPLYLWTGQYLFSANGTFINRHLQYDPIPLKKWLEKNEEKKLLSLLGTKTFYEYWDKNSQAEILRGNGYFLTAIEVYKELIDMAPSFPENYLKVAELYYNLRDYRNAINFYEKAFSVGEPITRDAALNLVKSYLAIQQIDGISTLKTLMQSRSSESGTESIILHALSYFYLCLGNTETSMDYAKRALNSNDDYYNTISLGKLLFFTGKYPESKIYFEKSLRKKDNPLEALCYLSMISDTLGNKPASLQYYNQAINDTGDFDLSDNAYWENFFLYPASKQIVDLQLKIHSKFNKKQDMNWYKALHAKWLVFNNKELDFALQEINEALASEGKLYFRYNVYIPIKLWIQCELGDLKSAENLYNEMVSNVGENDLEMHFNFLYSSAKFHEVKGNTEKASYYRNLMTNFSRIQTLIDPIDIKHYGDIISSHEQHIKL